MTTVTVATPDNLDINKLIQIHILDKKFSELNPMFRPTVNMNDAMVVEQALYEKGYTLLARRCGGNSDGAINFGFAKDGDFYCNVSKLEVMPWGDRHYKSTAETMPLAICYAALKSQGIDLKVQEGL